MDPGAWRMCIKEEEVEIRKGPWTLEEDTKLVSYVRQYGASRWSSLAKIAGLKRDGKSCRMRWLNYLRPDLKHGTITPEEDRLIIELHNKWGNRWSRIAEHLPGRTDNEIKNHWRSHIKKMSPEIARSYSWPPISETPTEVKVVREDSESRSSKSFEDQKMTETKECYAESNVPTTLNQLSCESCELHDGYRVFFSCDGINQELIKKSSAMDPLSDMVADEYAGSMIQHSPLCCCSSVTDYPVNVVSDTEEFLWDYNYIALWNMDDDIPMHK